MSDKCERICIGEFPFGNGSIATKGMEEEGDQDSSDHDPWGWPEDLEETDTIVEHIETNLLRRAFHDEDEDALRQDISSALEKFGEAAASEFGKAFEQILQILRSMGFDFLQDRSSGGINDFENFTTNTDPLHRNHRRLHYPTSNSSRRDGGNEWSFGGQGSGNPFTMLSYSYTSSGPPRWWDSILFGGVIVLIISLWGYQFWVWRTGRPASGSPKAVPTKAVPTKAVPWEITLPFGPIFVGYGFFWDSVLLRRIASKDFPCFVSPQRHVIGQVRLTCLITGSSREHFCLVQAASI